MADVGYGPKPVNSILVAGQPLVQVLKVETATNMKPGRLVKKGTNDDDVVVGTASTNNVGWLGYEQTIKKYRPSDVDTAYAANDQAAVLHGGGFVIVASWATGTCSKGDLLKGIAAGELSGGTAGTDHIVAIAEESMTGAGDIMVRSLI